MAEMGGDDGRSGQLPLSRPRDGAGDATRASALKPTAAIVAARPDERRDPRQTNANVFDRARARILEVRGEDDEAIPVVQSGEHRENRAPDRAGRVIPIHDHHRRTCGRHDGVAPSSTARRPVAANRWCSRGRLDRPSPDSRRTRCCDDRLEPFRIDVEVVMHRSQPLRARRQAAQVGVREPAGGADLDEPWARIPVRKELDDHAPRVAEQKVRHPRAVDADDHVGVGEELRLLAQAQRLGADGLEAMPLEPLGAFVLVQQRPRRAQPPTA